MGDAPVHQGGIGLAGEVIEQIKEYLVNKQNFLLSGGAGSGKTYTLIQTLRNVFELDATVRVACITYTNVAADEIKERSPYSKLHISTIHDFLWELIKGYQKNLKQAVVALIAAEKSSRGTGITYSGEVEITEKSLELIEYKNYRNLEKGTISHDDLLKVANYMFASYPLLSKILCDKYNYIFIDEYQDTQKIVINIFLNHIKRYAHESICIGFFGDKMQSIYDTGIGNIQSFVDIGDVKEVIKEDNYRCSVSVIGLLNQIRSDIHQEPSKKDENGIIANLAGTITFVYSQNEFDFDQFKKSKFVSDWAFDNPKLTKILFLTHKLIAKRIGFEDLLNAYQYNDSLIGNEPDRLASHLLKMGSILYHFENKEYSHVISEIQIKLKSVYDKIKINKLLSDLIVNQTNDIETMINHFNQGGLVRKDDRLDLYITEHSETYDKIKLLPFTQVMAYFKYYNDFSPYSTQHGIKGAEFDNVLVIMDNGRWNNYNFKYYFENTPGKESILRRTERIVYVCCSRAINNLVIYYPEPTPQIIRQAKTLFGDLNVHPI
jgi:DNA helicase-2/ATP-dependent DNA helicase PcrA